MELFHRLYRPIRNFFLPPRCVFCRTFLGLGTQTRVCADCMRKIPFCLAFSRCKKCGRPVPEEQDHCYRCGRGFKSHYRKVFFAYYYEGSARQALLRFKYERYQHYAPVFAFHIATTIRDILPAPEFDLVVSVPPRKLRLRKNRYDQAEALGYSLAKELGLPFLQGVLRQKRVRKKQSSLSLEERWQSVLGNYTVVRKRPIQGKRILLVDDICTTGATLDECAKILRSFGAIDVVGAVAAIASEEKNF